MIKKLFFVIAFIEGGALMSTELLGAKMISPYFGVSPYTWASVLSVTLLGLAIGYYAGGKISKKKTSLKMLTYILFFSAVSIYVISNFSNPLLDSLIKLNFLPGILASSIIILSIPLFLFGTVSPIIISLINKDKAKTGKTAGTVYSISTLGGIIFTFVFGFYLIPFLGTELSSNITAILLFLAAIISFLAGRKVIAIKSN